MSNSMELRGLLSLLVVLTVSSCVWTYGLKRDFHRLKNGFEPKNPDAEKIVGGTEMTANSWPFLVLFVSNYDGKWCGGSVLDKRHILSAAHCFSGDYSDPADYRVALGEHDVSTTDGNEQFINVERITIHPKYDDWNIVNDVAVIRLVRDMVLTSVVSPVDLNSDSSCPSPGDTCMVAGWGDTSFGGSSSDVALSVDVPVQGSANCTIPYGKWGYDTTGQVCAGAGGVDSCQGDSGGPLTCQCGGSQRQVGIVSYGDGCAKPGYPGVYVRVSYYRDWILQTMAAA